MTITQGRHHCILPVIANTGRHTKNETKNCTGQNPKHSNAV
jgi:hypothetical protein